MLGERQSSGGPQVQATHNHLVVDLDNVSYWYPDQSEPALRNVNLRIRKGEFVLVMGPTGCGKSTLALCLNGIVPWVIGGRIKGSPTICGLTTTDHKVADMAAKVALVQQDPESQLCTLYVRDEIAFGPQNLLQPKDHILSKLDETIRLVGLEGYENKTIFLLSGGEKQRLAIAAGVIMEPNLLVLDEPTANLDPAGAAEVLRLIMALRRSRETTIVLVEHNIDKFASEADRLVVMRDGEIVLDGAPRQLLRDHGNEIDREMGVWIPQVSQIALGAIGKGYSFGRFPVCVDDLDEASFSFQQNQPVSRATEAGRAASQVAIRFEKLGFRYPDGTTALKDITFNIEKGTVVAIMGKNGSGKSTLCSMCAGLRKPTEGRVDVGGIDVASASIRDLAKKVGYVFQYPEHQFLTNSVFDEVAFGLRATNALREDEIAERVMQILLKFRLDKLAQRHPFHLSMGQKRRLSIASMLVLEPKILILDEPTSGQDRRSVESLMEVLEAYGGGQLTLVLITHDMDLVGRHVTDVAVLDAGELVFKGKTPELYARVEDGHLPALEVPDTYRVVHKMRKRGIKCHDAFAPEQLLAALEVAKR